MSKNHKKILDEIGLQDISLTSRITPMAIWYWSYENHKMVQLCCQEPGPVLVAYYLGQI